MISCTDFIPAYSELFKSLEKLGGEQAVTGFWEYLSDNFLTNLKEIVEENGIRGCWLYWSHTLNEEAADFTMELDEDVEQFKIEMHLCPSKARLLQLKHIEPYHNYCGHCDLLYHRVLYPIGYDYRIDLSNVDKATCVCTVTKITDK